MPGLVLVRVAPSPGQPGPLHSCKCGVYGLKTAEEMLRQNQAATVFGLIRMWGRIIVHERGYRAQYAEPLALFSSMKGSTDVPA